MRKSIVLVLGLCLVGGLAGCTRSPEPAPTSPPVAPTHKIDGSVLPQSVAGYTALGKMPAIGQLEATYVRDAAALDVAVVTLDPSGDYNKTELRDQQWYGGVNRCGTLWEGGAEQTAQSACITVLTDGVMMTVSGGKQAVADLAQLAEAIHKVLA